MARSVKVNFVYNFLNSVVGLLFPIITFPYITRVIMAEGIGKVSFLSSIIGYIALFSAIGIPIYAIREVAKERDDVKKRNQTTVEILLLHLLLTAIGYVVVFILAFAINRIYQDIWLFLLLSIQLLLSAIGVLWFYQAVEDFKYITIRSLCMRVVVLIALFVFVKDKNDLYYYAAITILADVGNNIINFIHLRRYLKVSDVDWHSLNLKRHVKPSLRIFLLNLITSIYVHLDSVMLGFLSSDAAVGYYTAAVRITKATLGVIGTLGNVLLPRLSNYVATGAMKEFELMVKKAMNVIITATVPMAVGLIFIAPQLIRVFCGEGYAPSVLTLQLVSPIILFIGVSNMAGLQILYPQGKESLVIKSTLVGAIVNLCLNSVLIPLYSQYGAAFATCVAELSVTSTMLIIGRKYIPYRIFNKTNVSILVFSIIMCLPLLLIQRIDSSAFVVLPIEIIFYGVLYCIYMWVSKNDLFEMVLGTIKKH